LEQSQDVSKKGIFDAYLDSEGPGPSMVMSDHHQLTEEFLGLTSATNQNRVVDLHVPLPENFLLP
jgi:hypothetical protein